MKGGAFAGYHPSVNFFYFLAVLLFAMFFLHPLCLLISLSCAFAYSFKLRGKRALSFNLLTFIPMLLLCALLNPLFNHQGVTILFYLQDGNPVTLESVLYGLAAAMMLISVICWFRCYNAVMTSDKFIYLFGRLIPGLSLIFSMALRFVPRFIEQAKQISHAQRCIGRDISCGSIGHRARQGLRIISILITWALENALETAESMKSRGYGLPGRTAFSLFRFDGRDRLALLMILLCGTYVLVGAWLGGLTCSYFPSIVISEPTPFSVSIFIAYAALGSMPLIIEFVEDSKWKYIASRD